MAVKNWSKAMIWEITPYGAEGIYGPVQLLLSKKKTMKELPIAFKLTSHSRSSRGTFLNGTKKQKYESILHLDKKGRLIQKNNVQG